MDQATIANIMNNVVGHPSSGVLADTIPAMAAAVADALKGNGADKDGGTPKADPPKEERVVKASETR
jgi:hypothetical protein